MRMMPPLKPDACISDDKLAIFIGADYKMLPLAVADPYVRKLQGLIAKMKRAEKRAARLSKP
jgi:hypothetical protein